MKKIEVLFPEVCNLYGDLFNIKYLQKSLSNCMVFETSITEEPRFLTEDIDLVYMGAMPESVQLLVIDKLKPYKNIIQEKIEQNKVFLFTGNAMEVLEQYIQDDDGNKSKGLGMIDLYARIDTMHRFNTLFLGTFKSNESITDEIKITGFKSTFSMSYGDNASNYVFKSIKGAGINKKSQFEGVRINNFFGTYLIGPLLVLNPDFTKYIMTLIGENNPKLEFEEEAKACYKIRLHEFEKNETKYLQ